MDKMADFDLRGYVPNEQEGERAKLTTDNIYMNTHIFIFCTFQNDICVYFEYKYVK